MDADGNPTTPAEQVVAQLIDLGDRARRQLGIRSDRYWLGSADAFDDAADTVSKALTTGEPRLDIPDELWEANGDEGNGRSFLHCTVRVCGSNFIADAYSVQMVDHLQVADWDFANEEVLPAIYAAGRAEDGPFETVEIGGRDYVVVITPMT